MARRKKVDLVVVTCYGKQDIMERSVAMAFFLNCMMHSEGCEHERYETIYFQLASGVKEASDQIDWRY